VRYPQSHATAALAGRTAEFHITVKKVDEQSLPELDAEFCRAFGVENGDTEALRKEVRSSMQRELDGVIRNRVRAQVMDALYRDNPLEVPHALVDETIQQLQIETAQRIGARDLSQLPPRESFVEPARRRVALGMIVSEILRAEGIKLDRSRVQARIDDLASGHPKPEEARRAYLASPETLRQVESAVLEDQVLDLVLARAQVTDRGMTFKELTGFGPDAETQPAAPAGVAEPRASAG
jgi:trigger factor